MRGSHRKVRCVVELGQNIAALTRHATIAVSAGCCMLCGTASRKDALRFLERVPRACPTSQTTQKIDKLFWF
jgi:hydroxymethylglutaryl-CoA reductase